MFNCSCTELHKGFVHFSNPPTHDGNQSKLFSVGLQLYQKVSLNPAHTIIDVKSGLLWFKSSVSWIMILTRNTLINVFWTCQGQLLYWKSHLGSVSDKSNWWICSESADPSAASPKMTQTHNFFKASLSNDWLDIHFHPLFF